MRPSSTPSRRPRLGAALAALLVGPLAAPRPTQADDPPPSADLETARGLALGTGARASAASTSALAYNPAGLAVGRLYHLEGFFGYVPGADAFGFGASVADSTTGPFAAGLSFRGVIDLDDGGYEGWDGRLGLALALAPELSIGLSGRYLSFQRTGDAFADNDGDTLAQGFTMDASLRATLGEVFHIAALGENLIDVGSPFVPRRVGGGVALGIETFSIGGDVLVDLTSFDEPRLLVGGGLELLVAGTIPLRAGYRFDEGRTTHAVTGGLGFVDAKVGLEIALRQEVVGGSATELLANVRYFVQ